MCIKIPFDSFEDADGWSEADEEKLKSCQELSNYSYSQGNYIADLIRPFCINCMPECLLQKVKNDAVRADADFVLQKSWSHFEIGLQYSVSSYSCPKDIVFGIE